MKKTKEALRYHDSYMRSNMHSLWDAYDSFSRAKKNAWEYCQSLCNQYHGLELKVVSANGYQFTAGFEFFDEEDNLCYCHITKSRDIYYPLLPEVQGGVK